MEIIKIELPDRVEYKNELGQLHRLDGPAIENASGDKAWYQNGQRHRLDGPALELSDGTQEWFQNGQRHRLDGPALELSDGSKGYYIHNFEYSEIEYRFFVAAISGNKVVA